ncbi:chemotaxis protein CheB [Leptolyngbya sp. NK1-12]|uniref:protein-glutamate methylesterase n=1 Tax=Leptolyngbya sp. NK1-12 TaxID=2547451 RepID=A0AA97ANW6_9CYAN|nr:chemotaxis protein CheB [Leptolyngbya sp. NK1-12]WNZ27227.1 chemotaxis protein CheB [Leptolyngbya sp. NK1-12]
MSKTPSIPLSEPNGKRLAADGLEYPLVVIGASAGGVEALSQLVQHLPADLAAALFVVVHFPPHSISLLPKILSRAGPLPAKHVQDQAAIQPGAIYVAPPNHHLLVRRGYMRLSRGPRENGHRPAIDTLFRSAARVYGPQTMGVILSGALDDGTAGLRIIHAAGGITVAQDPEEALFDSMPRTAIESVPIDYVLKIEAIAQLIQQFALSWASSQTFQNDGSHTAKNLAEEEPAVTNGMEREDEMVAQDKAILEQGKRPGTASTFTCPDCGGVLWELRQNNIIRYRCHVGHAYSLDSLVAEQADDLERALWSAVRALEEKAALARRMAAQARHQHRALSEAQFLDRANEATQHADLVRQVILQQTGLRLEGDNGLKSEG